MSSDPTIVPFGLCAALPSQAGTAACAWHCCLCMAQLLVHGTAACAWHSCLCMAQLLVHGTAACAWHSCLYMAACAQHQGHHQQADQNNWQAEKIGRNAYEYH